MLLAIPGVLNAAQLDKIRESLAEARFVDGRLTAGRAAARVKNNEELEPDPRIHQRITRIAMSALGHNADFRNAALPHRMADFIVARYQPGMTYGDHVDDPIMGNAGPRFRSDVSMTLFLNPPESYDGGELVIRSAFGLDPELRARRGAARAAVRAESRPRAPAVQGPGRGHDQARRPVLREPAADVGGGVREPLTARENGGRSRRPRERDEARRSDQYPPLRRDSGRPAILPACLEGLPGNRS